MAFIKIKYFIIIFFTFFIISCKATDDPVSPVDEDTTKSVVDYFGLIQAKGNKIVDKNDNPVVLNGMSLFWSQWGGNFYNESCIKWLRDDWKCTVIRASCGIESGGYLENPSVEMKKIQTVIDAAIKLGIYVIVDWHDHNAQAHLEEAKLFFKEMAQKYGDKNNIIYEIYNEPLQVSWTNVIKPYSVEVINTIREYDPDNLIVAGTPTWSQDVDVASADPITDVNIAYSLHFYTSTHKQYLRDKANTALNRNIALFITEFGISEANGNGIIDYSETMKWLNFMNDKKLSACNWSIIDKNETSAALKPGASAAGNWTESVLSESGKYNRERIIGLNTVIFDSLLTK